MVEQVEPEVVRELLHIFIHLSQVTEERLDHFPLCLPLHDSAADLIQPFFRLVVAFGKGIVLLLVILLILCDMGVLADALLHQFCHHHGFLLQRRLFRFQLSGIIHLILDGFKGGDDLVPLLSENPQGFEVQCLDGVLVQMRRGTLLSVIVLVVAPPYDFSVLVVGVPHLRAVKAAAITASDFAGENADASVPVRIAEPPLHLLLHPVELCGRDNRFMVSLHIVLRHLALVLLLFLCQEVRGVNLLEQGVAFVFFVRSCQAWTHSFL